MFGYWEKKEEQEKEVTHMETIDRKYTKNVVSGRFYVKCPTRTDAEIIEEQTNVRVKKSYREGHRTNTGALNFLCYLFSTIFIP